MLGLLAAIPGVGPVYSVAAAVVGFFMRCAVCLSVLCIGVAWVAGDVHGRRKADAACQAASLTAQLAAKTADLTAARRAAAEAALRSASIQIDADAAKERADAYADELKKRPVPACNLTDADLRGMRQPRRRSR